MNIFITGGASGLGLGLAKRFLADGHTVGVCDLARQEGIVELPKGLIYFQVDVLNKDGLSQAIHNFSTDRGGLDIVVANAGISMPKARIPDFDVGRKLISINVIGTLNTFEPAIDIMRKQGHGQLAAMGSIAGTIGLPGLAMYGASKSAVIALCESLEIDLHPYGIKVTTVVPGFIATPLTQNNKHRMPFLMTQEKAVNSIYTGILKQKGFYVFPFPLNWISRILYHLPRSWYKFIMKKDPLGLAKE